MAMTFFNGPLPMSYGKQSGWSTEDSIRVGKGWQLLWGRKREVVSRGDMPTTNDQWQIITFSRRPLLLAPEAHSAWWLRERWLASAQPLRPEGASPLAVPA